MNYLFNLNVICKKLNADSLVKLEEAERRLDEEDYAAEKQRLLNVHKNRIRRVFVAVQKRKLEIKFKMHFFFLFKTEISSSRPSSRSTQWSVSRRSRSARLRSPHASLLQIPNPITTEVLQGLFKLTN